MFPWRLTVVSQHTVKKKVTCWMHLDRKAHHHLVVLMLWSALVSWGQLRQLYCSSWLTGSEATYPSLCTAHSYDQQHNFITLYYNLNMIKKVHENEAQCTMNMSHWSPIILFFFFKKAPFLIFFYMTIYYINTMMCETYCLNAII